MTKTQFHYAARSRSGRRYRPSRLIRLIGCLLIAAVVTLSAVVER